MISDTIYEHLKDIYHTKVSSLISSTTIIEPSFTVGKVINELSKNDSYDSFCIDGKSILTTNVRSLLVGKDIVDMNVKPFLSSIPYLTKKDIVQRAANIISHYRVRSVPVVDKGKIIGEVSAKSILKLLSKKDNKWIKANLIYTKNPITIPSDQSLSNARKLMSSKRIDHLPVVNKSKVQQVLTSYHLLHTINPLQSLGRKSRGVNRLRKLESKIGNLGSTRIPQCTPKDDLNFILDVMLRTGTTCCLVNLWDNLQGIITYRDILSLLAAKMESEIPLFIVGMPEEQKNVDLITSKFNNTLKRIQKVYSEIQEAKISLRKRRSGSKNRREGMYDVSIMITTPHYPPFMFKESGWDLSQVFETLSQRMLRRLSKRAKQRSKTSIRKMNLPITAL
jgi:CBS domain-containing protein